MQKYSHPKTIIYMGLSYQSDISVYVWHVWGQSSQSRIKCYMHNGKIHIYMYVISESSWRAKGSKEGIWPTSKIFSETTTTLRNRLDIGIINE